MYVKRFRFLAFAAVAILALALPAFAQPVVQTAVPFTFQDTQDTFVAPTPIVGATATLTRYEDAVALRVDTQDLPPGAYTVWWIVFNNPAGCMGGCGEDDLFRPEAQTSIFWATGGIVEDDGVGSFRAFVRELEMLAAPGKVVFPGTGGLLDAHTAEVHVAIKLHGEVRADLVGKQIGTIYGACTDPPGPVVHPVDPIETDRIFPCYDPQAAVFPALDPADIPTTCPSDPHRILENQMEVKSLLDRIAERLGLRP